MLIFALLASLVFSQPAQLSSTTHVATPYRIIDFAQHHPDIIKMAKHQSGDSGILQITPVLREKIAEINYEANMDITWTSDEVAWGVDDLWELPCVFKGKMYDDCDSIVLWKFKKLLEAGLPSAPMMFVQGYDELGEGHAILVIATQEGDIALDNRQHDLTTVQHLKSLGYNLMWRTASGADFAGPWVYMPPTSRITSPPKSLVQKPKGPPLCRR